MNIEKVINKHHTSLMAINTPESKELAALMLKVNTEQELSGLVMKSRAIHVKAFEQYLPSLDEMLVIKESIERKFPNDPFSSSYVFDTIFKSIEDAKYGSFFYDSHVTPETLIGALREQVMERMNTGENLNKSQEVTHDTSELPKWSDLFQEPMKFDPSVPEHDRKETDMKETQPPYLGLLQLLIGQIDSEQLKVMDGWSHVLNAKGPIPIDNLKDIGLMPVSTTSSMISNKHEEAQQQKVQHDRDQWLVEQLQKSTPVDRDYFNTWTGSEKPTSSGLEGLLKGFIDQRREFKENYIREKSNQDKENMTDAMKLNKYISSANNLHYTMTGDQSPISFWVRPLGSVDEFIDSIKGFQSHFFDLQLLDDLENVKRTAPRHLSNPSLLPILKTFTDIQDGSYLYGKGESVKQAWETNLLKFTQALTKLRTDAESGKKYKELASDPSLNNLIEELGFNRRLQKPVPVTGNDILSNILTALTHADTIATLKRTQEKFKNGNVEAMKKGLRAHCSMIKDFYNRNAIFAVLLRELRCLDEEQGHIFFNQMQGLLDTSPRDPELVKAMDSIIVAIQLKLKAIKEFAKPHGSSNEPEMPIQFAEGDQGDKEAELKDRIFEKLKQFYSTQGNHNIHKLTTEEIEFLRK